MAYSASFRKAWEKYGGFVTGMDLFSIVQHNLTRDGISHPTSNLSIYHGRDKLGEIKKYLEPHAEEFPFIPEMLQELEEIVVGLETEARRRWPTMEVAEKEVGTHVRDVAYIWGEPVSSLI